MLGPCAIDQHFGDEHLGLVRSGETLALPALVVVAGEADAIIEQSDDGNVLTGRRSSSNDCRLIFRHAYGRVRCTLRTVGNTGMCIRATGTSPLRRGAGHQPAAPEGQPWRHPRQPVDDDRIPCRPLLRVARHRMAWRSHPDREHLVVALSSAKRNPNLRSLPCQP